MNLHKQQLKRAIFQAIGNEYERYKYCEFVKRRRNEADTICLYGTGDFYINYVQHIKKYDYVCDSNPQKWGQVFDGRECISPMQLFQMDSVVVFVMLGKYKEVIEELNRYHIESYFFGDLFLNVFNEQYTSSWFQKNRKAMLDTIDIFEDEQSKEIYVNSICNRIAPQYAQKTFHEMEERGEYFGTGIFELGDDECYVDAGAYDGDSIKAFMEAVKGNFEQIYGFELDAENYQAMKNNPEFVLDNRIQLFNRGISSEEKKASIIRDGHSSRILEGTNEYSGFECLDNILGNKRITLIKMDIEGAEREGLKGARNIISSQNPKLAISVYHRLDDMWRIPQYIKELCPDYKIYMRHHTAVVWDTDCYAYVK